MKAVKRTDVFLIISQLLVSKTRRADKSSAAMVDREYLRNIVRTSPCIYNAARADIGRRTSLHSSEDCLLGATASIKGTFYKIEDVIPHADCGPNRLPGIVAFTETGFYSRAYIICYSKLHCYYRLSIKCVCCKSGRNKHRRST